MNQRLRTALRHPKVRLALADIVKRAAEEFSNHGCNDVALPNEDWAWELVQALDEFNFRNKPWDQTPEDQRAERPAEGCAIRTDDWFLLDALAASLRFSAAIAYSGATE